MVAERTQQYAGQSRIGADGWSLENAVGAAVPFPVPKSGIEAIWNYKTRYMGKGRRYQSSLLIRDQSGTLSEFKQWNYELYPHSDPALQPGSDAYAIESKQLYEILTPASRAGELDLIHALMSRPQDAWIYFPGQRRVRRAPMIAYDNSARYSNGLITADNIDGYNGAPDRYDWKLIGKQELLIPYNSYRLNDRSLKYSEIIQPNHINQDLTRYEKHRVWVVEATLKPGARHIYAKRRVYLDEDSWQIALVDQYDSRGELWRNVELHALHYYDQQFTYETLLTSYDLISGRYYAGGLMNEEAQGLRIGFAAKKADYTPSDLRRWAK